MQASLLSAGFDLTWLTHEISLHGPDLEGLLVDGLSMGLSQAFLVELVTKLGSIGISIIVDLVKGSGSGVLPMVMTKQKAAAILALSVGKMLS